MAKRVEGSERPMETVSRKIARLYDKPVREVRTKLGTKPLCVVTGAFGIGKSTSFIPRLLQNYTDHGVSCHSFGRMPFGNIEGEIDALPTLDNAQKGLVVVDEINVERAGIKTLQNLVKKSTQKGYQMIVIIAHATALLGKSNQHKYLEIWQRVAPEVPIVQLPLVRLSPALAREYLIATAAKEHGSFSEEILNLILDIVPGQLRLLRNIGTLASMMTNTYEARRVISQNLDSRKGFFELTDEEYAQAWSKLYPNSPLPTRRSHRV